MNQQPKRQPRKILGINNSQSQLNGGNLSLNESLVASSSSSNNNITLLSTPSSCSVQQHHHQSQMLTAQQQQQMERLRLANMMNQEMHALWPYGTTTFLSPMLPAPNVALPYALAGTLPYAVPIYPTGLNNSVPANQASLAQSNTPQQQQQQQCSQLASVSGGGSSSSNSSSCSSTTSSLSVSGVGQSARTPQLLQHQQQLPSDSKINIQIGLQCVSQNAPLNFNSMNELNGSLGKVNLLNFCGSENKDNKENSTSLRNSPILLTDDLTNSPTILNTIGSTGAGGDASNLSSPSGSGNNVTLSQAKFNELTRLALRGSEIAEKLAYTHRNRPCFKKIDSLCARMKQDLIRPDGVLPNINSQGIAWAVKDLIFVFTRVINAWIIIKGYVYNTPEGLNKVKAALSPEFASSFAAWQDITMDFVENLIKSFVNLDNLVQSQKNVYQKSESGNIRNSTNTTPIKLMQPVNTLLEDSFDFLTTSTEKSQQSALNKNYLYTMVEDSEGSQRQATANGTYFKTGTYNPIKKDALLSTCAAAATSAAAEQSTPSINGAAPIQVLQQASPVAPKAPAISAPLSVVVPPPPAAAPPSNILLTNTTTNGTLLDHYFEEQIAEIWEPSELIDSSGTIGVASAAEFLKIKEKVPPTWLNYDIRVLVQNLSEFSNDFDPNEPPRALGKDLIDKLNIMIERLMVMKNAELFFKIQFTKNYFPDFIAKHNHDFMDVRSIILKCQVGGYHNIFEVVHDIKKIIHTGKEFLKMNMDNKLQKSIQAFEMELNKMLNDPPFDNCQFEHITGDPKEVLFHSRNAKSF